jgi:hypothetical protein
VDRKDDVAPPTDLNEKAHGNTEPPTERFVIDTVRQVNKQPKSS